MAAKIHVKFGDEDGDASAGSRASPETQSSKVKGPLSLERLRQIDSNDGALSENDLRFHTDLDTESEVQASSEAGDVRNSAKMAKQSEKHGKSNGHSKLNGQSNGQSNGKLNGKPNGKPKDKANGKINGKNKRDGITVYYKDSDDESEDETSRPARPAMLNKEALRARRHELLAERERLPMYRSREQVLKHLAENRVCVLLGETGSGKSTQLPQLLYEADPSRERIAVTQPRRVAAISLATRVSEELGAQLGGRVGYSVRFQNKSGPHTHIKYLTDGMLLRELMLDPDLTRYTTVVLDEAHERTVMTDLLMGLLKRLLARRADLRIVVMSATLDAERFSQFFGGARILYVQGRSYPVERYYLPAAIDDVVDATVQAACQVNEGEAAGDVLAFLPGQDEIEKCCDRLATLAPLLSKEAPLLVPVPLYASLPAAAQARAFEDAGPRRRKVILATNIAETSLTIPGVRYVIDTGLRKVRVWKPSLGLDTLFTTAVSQASAAQRMGRAGREAPGKCFRLYTEDAYRTDLPAQTEAEILRTDVASVVLMLKRAGVDDVLGFEWLEAPRKQAITAALVKLYALRALDDAGRLTQLGREMVVLPLSPHLAAVLLHAKHQAEDDGGVLLSAVLDVAACLAVEDLQTTPGVDQRDAVNERKAALFGAAKDHGDLVMLRELCALYRDVPKADRKEWCTAVGVQHRGMRNVEQVRAQLEKYLGVAGRLERATRAPDPRDLVRCFLRGFVSNTALGLPDRRYRTVFGGQTINIHPSSMLFGRKFEAILYIEYVYTTKGYARMVSPVELDWLRDVGGPVFARQRVDE